MKYLSLSILLLFICLNSYAQLGSLGGNSWPNIADSQYVSGIDISGATFYGYYQKISNFNPTLKLARKDSVQFWIAINQNNATYSPKPDNEYVTKRDLTPITPTGCSGAVNLTQQANNGSGVYIDLGTNSGTINLTMDTLLPSYGGNRISIYYGGQILNSFVPYTYQDTTVTFNYNYDVNAGSIAYVRYATGGFHFPSNYKITVGCPTPATGKIFYGYTTNPNDTVYTDLQYTLIANSSSNSISMYANSVPPGVHYFTVRVPIYFQNYVTWYNSTLSHGVIPDQTWQAPVIYGNYVYYFSRGLQSFDWTQNVTFTH